jgi:hypothetical protein
LITAHHRALPGPERAGFKWLSRGASLAPPRPVSSIMLARHVDLSTTLTFHDIACSFTISSRRYHKAVRQVSSMHQSVPVNAQSMKAPELRHVVFTVLPSPVRARGRSLMYRSRPCWNLVT